jgi:hypothetical protein
MTHLFKLGATALMAIACLPGCAPLHVSAYAVPTTDMRSYRTYAWNPAELESTGDPRLDHNRFFQERVQQAVDMQMRFRGYEKVAGGTPDMTLHVHAGVQQRIDSAQLDSASVSCSHDECRPYVYDEGTLLIDVVNARTRSLIWRGWAERSLDGIVDDQNLMNQAIDRAVGRICARLPVRRLSGGRPLYAQDE